MPSFLSTLRGPESGRFNRNLVIIASSASLAIWTYNVIKKRRGYSRSSSPSKRGNQPRDEIEAAFAEGQKRQRTKPEPFSKIVSQLKAILKLVAGPREWTYASGVAVMLVLRTLCDLWLIQNGTQIEAAIITADVKKLKDNLGAFFIAMPSLALVNNAMKFFMNQLRLNLRYKLSQMLYTKYVQGLTYYRLNVLDSKCQNVDQLLTTDIEKFCNTIVDVYTNVSKPLLDIIILVQKLSTSYTGAQTPGAMIAYLVVAGTILTAARRPLTALTVKETQLEGQLRYVHSRLIQNCEEIAFYQGNKREYQTLMSSLSRLRSHLFDMSIFKFNIDYLDNIVARYFATVVGYLSLAYPFFTARFADDTQAERLEMYYKSGRMMVKLAESIGRLVLAGRDFSRLAAYTTRVSTVMKSIDDSSSLTLPIPSTPGGSQLVPGSGTVDFCDPKDPLIKFIDVPLCTPNGDLLIQSLNFTIKKGQHVIITGPNGSGKSSLFRLLGDLWPLYGGKLIKPSNTKLFYIPQRPYMTIGTFRDQIIYPDSYADMYSKGYTDEDLRSILDTVELGYLVERESFNSVQDWQEVLSGGEKQRVALARLIYHRPQFAILDECTSAVAVDVEQNIYRYLCEQIGCSLLSVTHRVKQLEHFHDHVLRFDGCGNASFHAVFEESLTS